MINERLRYIPAPGPDLSEPFWRSHGLKKSFLFKDSFSKREKKQLLARDFKKLSSLFSQHEVPFPKHPYSRIRFLGLLRYSLATKHFGYVISDRGFALAETGFGFVDIWTAEYYEEKENIPREKSLRKTGIHELLHCMEVMEWWKLATENRNEYSHIKRMGFATRRPREESKGPNASRSIGGRRLNEGLAQYLSYWTVGNEIKNKTAEAEVIEYLVKKIGIGPLIKGAYSKNGLRKLNEKMAEVFGKKSFREMLEWMGLEFCYNENEKEKENSPSPEVTESQKEKKLKYTKTLEYLKLMAFLVEQRAIIHAFRTPYQDKLTTVVSN